MKKNGNNIEQAIILAAGEGQRLNPLTASCSKVMLPLGGKPILQYVIEALVQSGIRCLLIVVGYHKEQIQDYFGSGNNFGAEISYVIQERQLGTAHALKHARDMAEDRFIVLSGDNIVSSVAISDLLNVNRFTILATKATDKSMLGRGLVQIKESKVQSIIGDILPSTEGLINTGIYVMGKEIFDFIGDELELPSVINEMIKQGEVVSYRETTNRWFDVIHHPDLLKLNNIVLQDLSPSLSGVIETCSTIKGRVSIGRETIIRANCYIIGPVSIGDNCDIGPNVCILPSTSIGNNTVIAPFTILKNSLIFNNVSIGYNSTIEDSIVSTGTVIRGHFTAYSGKTARYIEGLGQHEIDMGTVIGNDCQIEDGINVRPGVTVGNSSCIRAAKIINENVPDGSIVI